MFKKITLIITICLLTFTYCFSGFAEEIIPKTTTLEQDTYETEPESDEIVTYIKHYVTFIDKQRNTKRVVDVQHNRSVSKLIVSKKPIQYKKNKFQTFMYWATKTKSGYKGHLILVLLFRKTLHYTQCMR